MRRQTIDAKSILLIVLLLVGYFVFTVPSSLAQTPDYDQINEVAKQLNCPTCAGINLADCRTQTCAQWRDQIGDLLQQGYSDEEVLAYFVEQYGPQVLQEPPRSGFTLALWLLPVIALLAGGGWLFYTMRGWSEPKTTGSANPSVPIHFSNNGFSATSTGLSNDYLSQVEKDLGIEEV